MGTPATPGSPSQPAGGWFPNLQGLGLPRAVTNGLQQGFSLIYSLRDAVNQQQATVTAMVQYGSHQNRLQTNAQALPDGAVWFETDRATVFYQARLSPASSSRQWFYAGGIYYATVSNQATDLAQEPGNVGFLFLSNNQPQRSYLYRWNGAGWDLLI